LQFVQQKIKEYDNNNKIIRCAAVKAVAATKNIFQVHPTATVLAKIDVAIHSQREQNLRYVHLGVLIERILMRKTWKSTSLE